MSASLRYEKKKKIINCVIVQSFRSNENCSMPILIIMIQDNSTNHHYHNDESNDNKKINNILLIKEATPVVIMNTSHETWTKKNK